MFTELASRAESYTSFSCFIKSHYIANISSTLPRKYVALTYVPIKVQIPRLLEAIAA